MTEIKTLTKIALVVNAIIWLLFGVMLIFLFDMALNPEGWTNPVHPRALGGLMLISSLFAVLMLRKKEWEEIKFTFTFMLGMCTTMFIIEVTVLMVFASTFMTGTVSQMILDLIILGTKITLNIIAYIKQ